MTTIVATCFLAVGLLLSDDSAGPLLSSEERTRLNARSIELRSLAPQQQERIRKLHESVTDPNPSASRHRQALERFERWYVTLSSEEKQRIKDAPTPDERMVVMREIVRGQSMNLHADLAPLENWPALRLSDRPGRNPSDGPSPNYFRQQEALLKELDPKLTPFERETLAKTVGRLKPTLAMALATKYDVPVSDSFKQLHPLMLQLVIGLVEDPKSVFGEDAPDRMSPEEKQKAGRMAADLLMLPELDERTHFEFIKSQPSVVRSGIERISNSNTFAARFIVKVMYYSKSPDEAPPELRESLELVGLPSPSNFLQRFVLRQRLRSIPRRPNTDRPPRTGED